MKSLLTFKNVSKSFFSDTGETSVLDNVSFSLKNNEIIALIGPSGCGKSTILNLASSLDIPSSGIIEKNALTGYMFQRDNLFNWRTVFDNITLGLEINKTLNMQNLNYVKELIEKYGLNDFVSFYPSQISGGMRQRVALIRTLALKPQILLLDEPFASLDYQTRLFVLDDVYKILRNENKSMIIVTHDISEAISIANKVIILSSRPCKIKKIIEIQFENKNDLSPSLVRFLPEFQKYFELIYKELNPHEEK